MLLEPCQQQKTVIKWNPSPMMMNLNQSWKKTSAEMCNPEKVEEHKNLNPKQMLQTSHEYTNLEDMDIDYKMEKNSRTHDDSDSTILYDAIESVTEIIISKTEPDTAKDLLKTKVSTSTENETYTVEDRTYEDNNLSSLKTIMTEEKTESPTMEIKAKPGYKKHKYEYKDSAFS